jgi:5,10-methenyltetrahydrofolate synthetase
MLLADRQGIADEVRRQRDAAIRARVLNWWRQHRPACLGVYLPIRGEPDLQAAYQALDRLGASLALPSVEERAAPLAFFEWRPGDPLGRDGVGLPVPASRRHVRPDALLIPCLGFNAGRFRLGYGGGYYDRTLATSPRPLAVGIAYAAALAAFEPSAHDMPMDIVLTD